MPTTTLQALYLRRATCGSPYPRGTCECVRQQRVPRPSIMCHPSRLLLSCACTSAAQRERACVSDRRLLSSPGSRFCARNTAVKRRIIGSSGGTPALLTMPPSAQVHECVHVHVRACITSAQTNVPMKIRCTSVVLFTLLDEKSSDFVGTPALNNRSVNAVRFNPPQAVPMLSGQDGLARGSGCLHASNVARHGIPSPDPPRLNETCSAVAAQASKRVEHVVRFLPQARQSLRHPIVR